jgi:hypothetical protein
MFYSHIRCYYNQQTLLDGGSISILRCKFAAKRQMIPVLLNGWWRLEDILRD